MNLKLFHAFALSLLVAIPLRAQVQLFEADMSGIVPHVGGKWNQGIQEWMVGLEYTIDGRTTFGFDYSKPLKDTISFDASLKAYTINPYAIFEFIEPDNLKTFSFAIRADFLHENTTKKEAPAGDPDTTKLNNFRRTSLGGGPLFALRIFSSEKLVIVPTAAYEFFYVTFQKNDLDGTTGNFVEDNLIWHDVVGSCAVHYHFNEFTGILFEPKLTVQIGEGRTPKDLINVSAKLGLVRGF
jgi:hypothetical protein